MGQDPCHVSVQGARRNKSNTCGLEREEECSQKEWWLFFQWWLFLSGPGPTPLSSFSTKDTLSQDQVYKTLAFIALLCCLDHRSKELAVEKPWYKPQKSSDLPRQRKKKSFRTVRPHDGCSSGPSSLWPYSLNLCFRWWVMLGFLLSIASGQQK